MFEFWSGLIKSLLYNVHCVQMKEIKKAKTNMLTFLFYKNGQHDRQIANWWSPVVEQAVNSWLIGWILCGVHTFTVQIPVVFSIGQQELDLFQWARVAQAHHCPLIENTVDYSGNMKVCYVSDPLDSCNVQLCPDMLVAILKCLYCILLFLKLISWSPMHTYLFWESVNH